MNSGGSEANNMDLYFITGNAGKAKYLSDYFDFRVEHKKLDLPEIQSLDLAEIVADKARRAYEIIGRPVLVEDVSLIFKALDKLPGPLIKWFYETLGNKGLCDLLNRYEDKRAMAEVNFALCVKWEVKIFSGSCEGRISDKPKGKSGFGWDPVFIPNGFAKTWAEMSADEKHRTSMRRIALEKLKDFLDPK